MHELAHLLGAEEIYAEWTQMWVVNSPDISTVFDDGPEKSIFRLFSAYKAVDEVINVIDQWHGSRLWICEKATAADSKLDDLEGMSPYPPTLVRNLGRFPVDFMNAGNDICNESNKLSRATLEKYVADAKQVQAMLKEVAQNISDYDSIDKRLQKYVDWMK
jgi:hypothetical protein